MTQYIVWSTACCSCAGSTFHQQDQQVQAWLGHATTVSVPKIDSVHMCSNLCAVIVLILSSEKSDSSIPAECPLRSRAHAAARQAIFLLQWD